MSRMRNPYLADSDTDKGKDTVPMELNTPRYPGSKHPERGTGIYTKRINESGIYDNLDVLFRLDSGHPRESGIYTQLIDGSMHQGADNQRVLPDYSLPGYGHPPVTNEDGENYRDNTSVERFCDESDVRSPNDTLPWIGTATSHEFINEYEFPTIALANNKGSLRSTHTYASISDRAETPDIITETSRGSSIDKKPKYFIATLAALLLFLVVAAAIAIPLLVYMYDRNRVSDEYAEVTVNVTFNNTYLPEYNNKSSAEYQTLTTNICNSMTDVYKYKDSKYSDQYRGCRVDSVTPGSLVVTVVFYFIQTKVVDYPDIVGILEQNSVSVYQTTGLVVIQNTVTVISQSTVSSVPSEAIIVTTSTTSTEPGTTSTDPGTTTEGSTTTEPNATTETDNIVVTPVVIMNDLTAGPGSGVTLACSIYNAKNWTLVRILKKDGTSGLSEILSWKPNKAVTIVSNVLQIGSTSLSSSISENFTVSVTFNFSSVCRAEGSYRCEVTSYGDIKNMSDNNVDFKTNPSSMLISVTSSYSQNIPSVEYCSVVTTEAVSDFSVYIKKNGESRFTKISDQSISIISGIKKTSDFRVNETCSQNTNLTFTLTPTYPGMNGAEIKCEGTTVKGNRFTTSVQTITVNPAGVAFLDPTVLKYLDDGGSASITCAVRNIPNWNSIVIKHILKGSVSPEVVANVTQSDENVVSNLVPRVQLTAQKVTNISVKLEFTSVECTDEGQYICEVTNDSDNETAKDTMDFVLYRRPTLPELSLHIDQVENIDRAGSEHKCFGNTGYPPGVMKLEYLTTDMENFEALAEPSSILRMMPNETGIGACKSNKTYTFGLQMPQEWSQAIIRCSIENPLVLGDVGPLAVNDTIELILSSACNGTVENVYKSNFYNCSRFTHCYQGVPFVKNCNTGLVFGISKSTGIIGTHCDYASNVICEKDIQTTTTTTTTMAPDNEDIQCTDRYTFIGNAQIIIDCNVSISANQNLTVSRGDQRLAFVDGAGTVTNDGVADISVTFDTIDTPKRLKIRISNVKCRDESVYTVTPSNGFSTRATLKVKEKPKSSPTLTIPLKIVEDELWHPITCSGNVGYPKGRLKFEIKMPNNDTFQEVKANSSSYQEGNCSYNSEISLSLTRGMDMHGSVIRCSTENNETFEAGDPDVRSTEKIISVIPKSVCDNATGEVKNHPYDCNKYLTCLQGKTAVQSCQPTLYWNNPNQHCVTTTDHCPPNTVLTTTTMAPTTTKIPPGITFQDLEVSGFIDTDSVITTCILRNMGGWSTISITKEGTAIFTINAGSTTDSNLDTRIKQAVSDDGTEMRISLNFTSILCSDEGIYTCSVQKASVVYNATMKMSAKQIPDTPVLVLNPNQIENTSSISYQHKCDGYVGYPGGSLILKIRKIGESTFQDLIGSNMLIIRSRESSKGNCSNYETLKFGLKLTMNWDQAEIVCLSDNQAILPSSTEPPSANATIELIPGSFCDGKSNGNYRHPYNCSRYVRCDSGRSYVLICSSNTCFDDSTRSCYWCHYVVCEVTTTAVPTTPAQSSDISCVGASAYIGETVALSCIFNTTTFHNISITRLASGTNQLVANIQGDGSVQHQSIQNIQVTFNTVVQPKEIVINITNVLCNDDGSYTVSLNQQAQATASLIVKNKITTQPSLELGVDIMENEMTDDIICRGNLGNPKGELSFEMKLQGESNFTVITGVTPTLTESTGNCDTQQNATIKITAQMSMNNSLVRCNMINSNTGQTGSKSLVSNEVPFLVVPQSVCTGEDGNRTYHPYECNKYVWCLLSNRVVQKCSASNLCFDKTIGNCQTACSQCPPNSVVPSP